MNLSALIAALDEPCRNALEDAANACVSRGGYEISIEDYMDKLLPLAEVQDILVQFERSGDRLAELLEKGRQRAGTGKNTSGRPVFSPLLVEFLQESCLLANLEVRMDHVSPGILILALLRNPIRYGVMPFFKELEPIPTEELQRLLTGLKNGFEKNGESSSAPQNGKNESAIKKYTTDFTDEARNKRIDPVFARGPEIRQMVDTLTRRRKNNPILVGDPGVGKTAVVEGLALKVVENDVPDALKGVRIVGLDMGSLQAGASVKGEFEKRLKGVIDEVKASPVPTILFIDEAHTLVGSGNAAGSGDAANLLKPALARGELRTIAATTWSEYKKYFEKDAALARRFQLVKLDEPSTEETVTILRGIVPSYEANHKVYIRDDAVTRTAELASRYISGRFLPDKAIDVLDTACARVRVSMGAKPAIMEECEEALASAKRELDALERDSCKGITTDSPYHDAGRHASCTARCAELGARIDEISKRWQAERDLVTAIFELRTQEVPPAQEPEQIPTEQDSNSGSTEATPETGKTSPTGHAGGNGAKLEQLIQSLKTLQGSSPLVFYEVCPALVEEIVSELTGIPVKKLGADETEALSRLGKVLGERIKGQSHAIATIETAVTAAKAGLNSPTAPSGIFLFVGPSGVGKTETALAVAEELFGDERMLISINMSEFQEKHTISRLIGSPPGYVGYGEGGRLTEAVRRQPYSPVLFDEVEKAHPDVLNLFYQMFDKGVLADGEGREINFRNTMIFLTSNIGSDIISALYEDDEPPSPSVLHDAIRPALAQFFKPALLGRMTIVPYGAIRPEIMRELVIIKLSKIAERVAAGHRVSLGWSADVVDSIVASCTAVDTGARNIDHIITASLLPGIATTLLGALDKKAAMPSLMVGLDKETKAFSYNFTECSCS